jgi:CRISP-associated protein Cas1
MLSLGYVLLGQAAVSALEVAALDPYDGFFHSDRYGRPALALDLIEEFRSIIVDSVALTIVGKKMLTPGDFRPGPQGGCYLKRPALKEFLREFSDRMETRVQHPVIGRALTYQQCLEAQARLLRKAIEDPTQEYQPFRTR